MAIKGMFQQSPVVEEAARLQKFSLIATIVVFRSAKERYFRGTKDDNGCLNDP